MVLFGRPSRRRKPRFRGYFESLEHRRVLDGSISGFVFNDFNADGLINGQDTGTLGQTVYIDRNHNGALDSGPITISAFPSGVSIPDLQTTTINIPVADVLGTLQNLTVNLDITHTLARDLDLYLVSPAGTTVPLALRVGGPTGQNFTSTVFNDAASTSINSASAPFTGSFRPASPLSVFNGESIVGTWKLLIIDQAAGDVGTENSFSLTFTTSVNGEYSQQTAVDGSYSFVNLPSGSFDLKTSIPTSTVSTIPSPSNQTVTLAANEQKTLINFGYRQNPGSITGLVYNDANADGFQESNETGVPGFTVYVDTNQNGQFDVNEPSAVTDAGGQFIIAPVPPGSTSVSFVQQTNWQQTGPVNISIGGSALVDATPLTGNQFEPAVAINPYNAQQRIVVSSDNGSRLVASISNDGGSSYSRSFIANGVGSLPAASGSPALAWDNYGNLFLAYRSVGQQIILAYSTDAGQTFSFIGAKNAASTTTEVAVAAANNQVWIGYSTTSGASPGIFAAGTPVLGTGVFGAMQTQQSIAGGSLSGAAPSLAIGTAGDVLVAYQSGTSASGLTSLMVARDPDGLGAQIFQSPVTVASTNVGQADTLPGLTRHGINASPTLLIDRSNEFSRGRAYLFYTTETPDESNDFDINFVTSLDNGASWSASRKINSISVASQVMPYATIDNLSGYVYVAWYDARNSPSNNSFDVYGSLISAGGAVIGTNQLVSSGTLTNAGTAATGLLQFGDRLGIAYDSDKITIAWADNSNAPNINPDGAGSTLDVVTRRYDIVRSVPSNITISVPTVNLVTNAIRFNGNQIDPTVAIDPSDTDNRIVFATDVLNGRLYYRRTNDGGATNISGTLAFSGGPLPRASGIPSAAWDNLGNLFVGYHDVNGNVDLLLSRDAGQSFTLVRQFSTGFSSASALVSVSVAAANNQVSVAFIGSSGASTLAYAASAPTIAGGTSGPFIIDFVPGSVGARYPSLAIGTSGASLLTYQVPQGASNPNGPSNIMVSSDPDGAGPLRFSNGQTVMAATSNVGFADTITPMNTKGVNAGQTVLWNQGASNFPNRAYLIYSDETLDESSDLDVFIKYSDDNGATWSAPQQVNDDGTSTAQFLPFASLDATTGNIFVAWFDGRNNFSNTTVRTWGTLITDGGQTVAPNVVISGGNSDANVANALPNQLGNRLAVAFVNGVVETYWPDNSNSTNNNSNGTLNQFDIYQHTLDVTGDTSGSYTLSLLPPAAVNRVNFGNHTIGNVAPFLDTSGTFTMTSITQNDSNNTGTLVTALLASSLPVQAITEFNVNDPSGIALTRVDTSLGSWQYTLDGGTTWRFVNSAADTHALLLPADANTRIRLLPNANLSGTQVGAISFRAWDQSIGVSGTYQDASQANALSAFSLNTASARLPIVAINTPPVIRVPLAQGVRPNGGLVFTSAVDNAITISDIESDKPGQQATVAITLQASHGKLTLGSTQGLSNLTGNGTGTLIFNGTTSDVTSDLLGLLFTPDAAFSGDAQIQITVNDAGTSPGPSQQSSATIPVSVRELVSVESGTLIITGTTADDVVALSLAGGNIALNVNGTVVVDSNTSANYAYMPVRLITGGGFDTYTISTATTADNVLLQPYHVTMTNASSGYSVDGIGAQTITVFGQNGDTGQVYDTPGNDVYYGIANSGFMVGSGQRLMLSGFGVIDAYTVNGGSDVAQLFDMPAGADTFIAQPGGASMQGSGYLNRASYFTSMFGFASGSNDTAQIYGTVSDDVLGSVPAYTIISSTRYYAQATGFGNAYAFGNGGYDIAVFYDSFQDDQYAGLSTYSLMSGFGYFNQATDFDSYIALSVFGGSDQAQLYDSLADDNFIVTPQVSYVFAGSIANPTYSNQAWNFKQIAALSTIGGIDTVSLIDSSGNDFLYAASYFAILTMPNLTASVSGFAFVNAYSIHGGNDSQLVQSPNYTLSVTGPFNLIG